MFSFKKRICALTLTLICALGLIFPAAAYDTGSAQTRPGNLAASAAVDTNGNLWCWGLNLTGQLGDGTTTSRTTPVKVLEDVAFVTGESHRAAIKTDGSLWMWGYNGSGELGNGGVGNAGNFFWGCMQTVPTKIMDEVMSVSCGESHTAIIKTDNTLWMCGSSSNGQLGSDSLFNVSTPTKLMDGVSAVSCGDSFTAAVKTDGSLWMWGKNDKGQLGNGGVGNAVGTQGLSELGLSNEYPYQTTPVKVMDNIVSVSCGSSHTGAIDKNGTLWMWGYNQFGQLGNGAKGNAVNNISHTYQNTPVKVMDNVAAVSCGEYVTAILKTDGTLWTCGYNEHGNLATPTALGSKITYPVKVMNSVAAVACSNISSITVLKTDGTVWTCGRNQSGQLGVGDTTDRSTPVQVPGLKLNSAGAAPIVPVTPAQPKPLPTVTGTAYPSTQTVTIDSFTETLQTYALKDANGNLTNYIKLRDLAYVLNYTPAHFDVGWSGSVNIVFNASYWANGSEMQTPFSGERPYTATPGVTTNVNGTPTVLDCFTLTDDNGGGYTYYKLRDLGKALGFNVGWSAEKGMYIQTDRPYTDAD